jgi:phospholipid N-methyltransferase
MFKTKKINAIGFCCLFSATLYGVPFWWETLKNPSQVGAIFQCTAAVGEELVRFLKEHKGPKRILELGAGKGPMTEVICKYLGKDDVFDIIEIDPAYCVDLYAKFGKVPQAHVHCADALEFRSEPYDFIICTLPFNVFEIGTISLLQKHIVELAKPHSYMSYVEYRFLPAVRTFFSSKRSRTMIELRKSLMNAFKNKYLVKTNCVFKNAPPIYIHHLKIEK